MNYANPLANKVEITQMYDHTVTNTSNDTNTEDENAPPTWQDRVSQLPTTQKWATEVLQTQDDGQAVAAALRNGQSVVAISDGSYAEDSNLATSSFILSPHINNIDKATAILGANQVPGNSKDLSAY